MRPHLGKLCEHGGPVFTRRPSKKLTERDLIVIVSLFSNRTPNIITN